VKIIKTANFKSYITKIAKMIQADATGFNSLFSPQVGEEEQVAKVKTQAEIDAEIEAENIRNNEKEVEGEYSSGYNPNLNFKSKNYENNKPEVRDFKDREKFIDTKVAPKALRPRERQQLTPEQRAKRREESKAHIKSITSKPTEKSMVQLEQDQSARENEKMKKQLREMKRKYRELGLTDL